MFDNIIKFFKNLGKKDKNKESSDTAKERLHLVLMQDRANVSADFLELMKQEIIEVIKKYIDVDEKSIDVRLTNKTNDDGTVGAPALYANIPIVTIKNEARIANVPKINTPTDDNKEEISEKVIEDAEKIKQEAEKVEGNEGQNEVEVKEEIEKQEEKEPDLNQENTENTETDINSNEELEENNKEEESKENNEENVDEANNQVADDENSAQAENNKENA